MPQRRPPACRRSTTIPVPQEGQTSGTLRSRPLNRSKIPMPLSHTLLLVLRLRQDITGNNLQCSNSGNKGMPDKPPPGRRTGILLNSRHFNTDMVRRRRQGRMGLILMFHNRSRVTDIRARRLGLIMAEECDGLGDWRASVMV